MQPGPPVDLDPASIKVSLAAVFSVAATLASVIAAIIVWLAKAAWKRDEANREMKHAGLIEGLRISKEDNGKLREEIGRMREETVRRELDYVRMDTRLKAVEQDESAHASTLERMRETMASKEFVTNEFRPQNVTLGHLTKTLEEVKQALDRKQSIDRIPAVTGQHRDVTGKRFDR